MNLSMDSIHYHPPATGLMRSALSQEPSGHQSHVPFPPYYNDSHPPGSTSPVRPYKAPHQHHEHLFGSSRSNSADDKFLYGNPRNTSESYHNPETMHPYDRSGPIHPPTLGKITYSFDII